MHNADFSFCHLLPLSNIFLERPHWVLKGRGIIKGHEDKMQILGWFLQKNVTVGTSLTSMSLYQPLCILLYGPHHNFAGFKKNPIMKKSVTGLDVL